MLVAWLLDFTTHMSTPLQSNGAVKPELALGKFEIGEMLNSNHSDGHMKKDGITPHNPIHVSKRRRRGEAREAMLLGAPR